MLCSYRKSNGLTLFYSDLKVNRQTKSHKTHYDFMGSLMVSFLNSLQLSSDFSKHPELFSAAL